MKAISTNFRLKLPNNSKRVEHNAVAIHVLSIFAR